MARMPRLVVPGYPHHVTQRGVRKQRTFFKREDYEYYLSLIRKHLARAEASIWAYCLMPNHVHLIVVPEREDSLKRLFGPAHSQYSLAINKRFDCQGHLWQARFHSCVMDEPHLRCGVRYVELNPVRAGLCHDAVDWPWSSVNAHLRGKDDALVRVGPMLDRFPDWRQYLNTAGDNEAIERIRAASRSGRPLGESDFIKKLEDLTKRRLRPAKRGPKTGDSH